jgi:hypothetical protein
VRRREGDAKHIAQHRDAHLHAYAREKADQHGARQEVGEKTEFKDPGHEQQHRGQQGDHAGQRNVLGARNRRHGGELARENGRGRRVRSDHKVP